ncbi:MULTISPECIES: class I SAM-dependent methyltransferase [Pseudoalteromonas]|uniref:Methyltransferase domain-containing protein n=1 Tax=Pseudoalteromonas byunsanensis TaxID=327939 RepID=A0A1S1NAQ1_9GAMM|nr:MULTISPECIES: class I SAM-dependent methyltransferase [Pseudoalteromonas]OHU95779.1 hypothetical protein BIW53_08090 [Pseudoalteromonas byunsanensis]
MSKEKKLWFDTTPGVEKGDSFSLGPYFSVYANTDPKHLVFSLARYKFVLKMLKKNSSVIELGCSDGFGTQLLKERASKIHAVDFDHRAINWAKEHLADEKVEFIQSDILTADYGKHDMVFSLDVIEHIYPENEHLFIESVKRNLADNGAVIIGTPNITAEKYATLNEQHVNLYSGERLQETFEQHFHNVFLFGMNDEVLHTGYTPMCHYLFVLACNPK